MNAPFPSARLLKAYRKRQDLTQRDVARLCGVSVDTVSNWERGVTEMPSRSIVDMLSEVYAQAD